MKSTPRDFDDAISEARDIERELETLEENYAGDNRIFYATETPVVENREPYARLNKTCQICEKNGHEARECWKYVGHPNRQRQAFSPQPASFVPGEPRKCYGCGQVGHIRRSCPKRRQPMTNLLQQLQGLMQQPQAQIAPQTISPELLQQIPQALRAQNTSGMPLGMEIQKNENRTLV